MLGLTLYTRRTFFWVKDKTSNWYERTEYVLTIRYIQYFNNEYIHLIHIWSVCFTNVANTQKYDRIGCSETTLTNIKLLTLGPYWIED